MPRLLTHGDYVAHIQADTARLRAALAACDPTTAVPSCPTWTATDLLAHHARVVHLWATFVERRPVGPADLDEPELPAGYADLLTCHQTHAQRLVAALGSADSTEKAWTWSMDQTVGFIVRRQAHEAMMHRLDAEQTAGAVTRLDPVLAADGVDEVLDIMYGATPSWGTFTGHRRHVRVDTLDVGGSVWVETGRITGADPDTAQARDQVAITVTPDPGVSPAVVIQGTAAVLDAWLWRRGNAAGIEVTGDAEVYAHFAERIELSFD